eukprot:CAMPEP_0171168964 /NCGR_PEP_ID=MMETSP0790-20130122/7975_1 /TAXON_ID=2925 /ORGANISM="Alexandrium catenella, Strain OF101" /LENGTH=120 /DNA_ID=CAMNT_0011633807 /DNA_START=165 /DNA_END=527 /DNA_ORIENTATION=-
MARSLIALVFLFVAAAPSQALLHGEERAAAELDFPKRAGEGRAGSSRGHLVEAPGEKRSLDSLHKEALSKMHDGIEIQKRTGAAVVSTLKNKVKLIKEGLPDLKKRVDGLAKFLADGFHR